MTSKWDTLVLRNALWPTFLVLQTFGHWPPEDSSETVALIYRVYAILFVGFIFILYMITEIINILLSLDDLEKITEASFLFLTHLAQLVKLYHFVKNNGRIRDLANSLQGKEFRARNEKQYKMLKRSMFKAQFTFYMFISMAWATCILWGIFPLVDSTDEKMSLPLSSYYPFSTDNSPVFEIIFIYQIVATTINASTNVSMDTTVSGFMTIICGELEVLNDTLLNIKEIAVENLRRRAGTITFNEHKHESVPIEVQAEMDGVLVECVQHHWKILHTTKQIDDLFNIGVLCQFAAGCIIICITMFELTLVELFSLQFVSMVLYQGCILVEIFLYCWFGNEIILKSSDIAMSIYRSDWYRSSIAYKKNILMLMTRAQAPIRVYAGNLFVLSLITFAAIIRTSWSYFAVLRRVHNEE